MSYTFGYIREAVLAHLDQEEAEAQAMRIQERYHIFANEAMQAICAVKPKYQYFKCTIVKEYRPLIKLDNNQFRPATIEEIEWRSHNLPEPNFADEIDTKIWYENKRVYLIDSEVNMPNDFVAFASKQAWAFITNKQEKLEAFISGRHYKGPAKTPLSKDDATYYSRNTIVFHTEGEYWIPYKGVWFIFKSGIQDDVEIDMPIDILLTIPIYVASACLQIDNAEKALAKRAEFELALSRCTNTDLLDSKLIIPSFSR